MSSGKNLPVPRQEKSTEVSTVINSFSEGGSKFSDFLPGALAVTEKPPSSFARNLIYISAVFLVVLLVWAAFSSADKVVVGQGKVRPAGQVQIINHPIGGKVSAIYVKQGDRVTKGQKLMLLDPITVGEELIKLKVQMNTLRAEILRLEAESSGKPLVWPEDLKKEAPEIVSIQNDLYGERRGGNEEQRITLQSEVEQRRGDIMQYEARVSNGERALALANQQLAAAQELEAKGYYPKLRVLQIERDVTGLRSELEQSKALLIGNQAGLREAQAKLGQIGREVKGKAIDDLSLKRTQFAAIRSEFEQYQNQQRGLELVSPVNGVVEKMDVNNVGQSVQANREIMNIVPEDQQYIIDVIVKNKDIGYVRQDMEATMKFQTYDYQRYGKLKGKVLVVPTDGTPNEKTGELLFTVQVQPEASYLANNPKYRIGSGMQAEVDFHVGSRTILSYVIDTITRTRDEAFRE